MVLSRVARWPLLLVVASLAAACSSSREQTRPAPSAAPPPQEHKPNLAGAGFLARIPEGFQVGTLDEADPTTAKLRREVAAGGALLVGAESTSSEPPRLLVMAPVRELPVNDEERCRSWAERLAERSGRPADGVRFDESHGAGICWFTVYPEPERRIRSALVTAHHLTWTLQARALPADIDQAEAALARLVQSFRVEALRETTRNGLTLPIPPGFALPPPQVYEQLDSRGGNAVAALDRPAFEEAMLASVVAIPVAGAPPADLGTEAGCQQMGATVADGLGHLESAGIQDMGRGPGCVVDVRGEGNMAPRMYFLVEQGRAVVVTCNRDHRDHAVLAACEQVVRELQVAR